MFTYREVVEYCPTIPKWMNNIDKETNIDMVDCDGNTMLHNYANNKNVK